MAAERKEVGAGRHWETTSERESNPQPKDG